jgi:hypothetical protein
VRVAAPDAGQPELAGEAGGRPVPDPPERRRVERLDGVESVPGVRFVHEATDGPGRDAERVRGRRVRRDREPALVVDPGDALAEGAQLRHTLLEEEAEEMAAAGRDLLADDHAHVHAARLRDPPTGHGRVDPVVVRDRDDVKTPNLCSRIVTTPAANPTVWTWAQPGALIRRRRRHGRASRARSVETAHHCSGWATLLDRRREGRHARGAVPP